MAVDMFLKLDGVPGEARDNTHEKEIDIHTYSWSIDQPGDFAQGFGGASGRVSINKLTITKSADASSHILMKNCIDGKHIDTGTLTIRKAGGSEPVEYIVYDFEKILVTNVTANSSSNSDGVSETVSLAFQKVTFKYQEQGDDGAKLGGTKEFSFDIATNVVA